MRNIPFAVIFDNIFVVIVYLVNSLDIMGIMRCDELQNTGATYM